MLTACQDRLKKRLPLSKPNARSPGFGLADLVIAYHENGQSEKSKDAARRLLLARRDFTIAAWLKTQVRRDKARLEADVAALRTAGLAMG